MGPITFYVLSGTTFGPFIHGLVFILYYVFIRWYYTLSLLRLLTALCFSTDHVTKAYNTFCDPGSSDLPFNLSPSLF